MINIPSDWIETVIRINSETHRSNADLAAFLKPLLIDTGFKVLEQRIVENGAQFVNLVAYNRETDSPDLMAFNTHLDTVAGGNPALWTKTGRDPFRATLSRNRVYGLGSADVKLDFLCKIIAARRSKPWPKPICLVGTYGEERGLVGAIQLFKERKIKPKYAIIGEPSNLELIYAHKGHLVITVRLSAPTQIPHDTTSKTWKGRAAHSSTPELGKNALMKGLTECFKRSYGIHKIHSGTNTNRIPDHCEMLVSKSTNVVTQQLFRLFDFLSEFSRELIKRRDTRFRPATSTLSLTMAETRDGFIDISFDVRVLPEFDVVRLRNKIVAGVERLGLSISFENLNFPLKGKRESRLMRSAAQALKNCKVTPVLNTKASSTEASVYQQGGAESFVFGPGISINNAHRPNEYNLIRQMDLAVQFYSKLMVDGVEGI